MRASSPAPTGRELRRGREEPCADTGGKGDSAAREEDRCSLASEVVFAFIAGLGEAPVSWSCLRSNFPVRGHSAGSVDDGDVIEVAASRSFHGMASQAIAS